MLRRNLARSLAALITLSSSTLYAATCEFQLVHEWNSGFTSSVKITNNSDQAISVWTASIAFSNGSWINGMWNASLSGSNPYLATNKGYNSTIRPNNSVSFGFNSVKGTSNTPAQIPTLGGDCVGGSANNPPTANATASVLEGAVPLTVDFSSSGSSDPDGDALGYLWNFGDGTTSNGANPSHTYSDAGTHAVSLTVNDGNGDSATADLTIKALSAEPITAQCEYIVREEWNSGFTATVRITNTAGLEVNGWTVAINFPDNSSISHYWSSVISGNNPYQASNESYNSRISPNSTVEFGFNTNKATPNSPAKIPDLGGICGSVHLNQPPVAAAVASSLQSTVPLTVNFDASNSSDPDGDALVFFWNFGNGDTSSEFFTTRTYDEAGIYTISLTVIDEHYVSNATSVTIVVSDPLPSNTYNLDAESSSLHFVSTKKIHIIETHSFTVLSGSISAQGDAVVAIKLDSVETGITTRNERMRNFLFETDTFTQAVISLNVDMAQLSNLAIGDSLSQVITPLLDLHGVSIPIEVHASITRLTAERLLIRNTRPITSVRASLVVGKIAVLVTSLVTAQITHAADCQYTVIENWDAGFKAEISIVNNGAPLTEWEFSWPWGANTSFNSGWNATYNCSTQDCTVTPPSWQLTIETGQTYTFGFITNKADPQADHNIAISGTICDGLPATNPVAVSWQLDGDNSSVQYVSMKKDHTAEVNEFIAADGEPNAISGSISATGETIFAVNLNNISTGVDIRNSRLLSLLFETNLLPTAYFRANINATELAQLAAGDSRFETLTGDFSLHSVRQVISAEVLISKISTNTLLVSTVKPVHIDSKTFDMAQGIEALRVVANLSSIGEAVPVYFQLRFDTISDGNVQPVNMPQAPADPGSLVGDFDTDTAQASLNWVDNSTNETLFLVRRKPSDGNWQTTTEIGANTTTLVEGLPDVGEFDYKVIAINSGVPSLPSNIERVTVTEGNQLAQGQQIYVDQCAGCHGVSGEGVGSFPKINVERDVDDMTTYIATFMPLGNAGSCDQQCAEDVATFIQTLWVTETICDPTLTPVSYGARQLKILTRSEYQNSVEDLLGIDFPVADGLSADSKVGFFTNNTYAAIIPSSYSNYLLVAEEIAQWSVDREFAPALNCTSYNQDCADDFISNLHPAYSVAL